MFYRADEMFQQIFRKANEAFLQALVKVNTTPTVYRNSCMRICSEGDASGLLGESVFVSETGEKGRLYWPVFC